MMIRKHWRYAKYVLRHKWYVFLACRKYGAPFLASLTHDLSKFRPDEWGPYAEWFYGFHGKSWVTAGGMGGGEAVYAAERAKRKEAFERAFLLHLHRNPHHWQYWVLPAHGTKPAVAFEMPERYVREMLADWEGAGHAITGKADTLRWYEEARHDQLLHLNTQLFVETTLGWGI